MKITYPLAYNPILEYWAEIESGREVVSNKIRKTYRKVVDDVNKTDGEYFYSAKRANHVIEFAENFCKHSKGKFGGKPVKLELWEKALLATIFGFVDINGCRKYREALLIVGKKNGKSLLSSIVGLYLMVADNEAGPEIYAVATKKDQAKIIWQEAKRMVKKSPVLLRRIKPLTHELSSENFNEGTFRPLASDSDTLDGLNVHGVLMDEIHQWKNGKALFDIMADGTTAREQPLIFITSTAGTVREDIYDEKYEEAEKVINGYENPDGYRDEHFIAFVYELDNRKEWKDPSCWKKANPGLGTIKNLEQLKAKVDKAKQNPALVKNLVCKEFNIRETTTETWLTFEQINNTAVFDIEKLKPRYGIGGVDLSTTTDLTAAKAIFRIKNDPVTYVLSMYWILAENLAEKAKEDKAKYVEWVDNGYMRAVEGNKINPKYVTEWFLEIQKKYKMNMLYIGYDAWSAEYWVDEMRDNFGKQTMIPIRQGKKTLSEPMKTVGADLTSKLINYNNNPVDKWCLANTKYDEDKNGNIQPCKTSKRSKRIDGTAALLDCYAALNEVQGEYMSMIK